MNKTRLLSLILALLTVLVTLAGCSGKEEGDEKEDAGTTTVAVGTGDEGEQKNSYEALPTALKAEKIGSISPDIVYTDSSAGLRYKGENGKYGIITLDGMHDTGAKYVTCEAEGNYFQVTNIDVKNVTDVASLNCVGVVDATGKEIIPMKYATISKLNDRYFRVCEVTEQTTNEDEAIVYFTDNFVSLTATEGDILFKGNWYIYDMVAGKLLDGITETNSYYTYAYGNFVKYITDEQEEVIVNDKGMKLPEGADLFRNGCYALVKDNAGAVYNSDGKKMFDYNMAEFVPYESEDHYILAVKTENGARTYVVMDQTGKTVSSVFNDSPQIFGDLIYAGEKVYDFSGNAVVAGSFESVYFDDQIENTWLLRNGEDYTLIKKDGTVLYQSKEDDSTSVETSWFVISKKVGDKRMYYSLADKDFTIEGYSLAPWLVKIAETNNLYGVVDTISGEKIISGYKNYYSVAVPGSVMYVYAVKADGGIDVYKVK